MANVAQAWADSSTSEQYLQSALSQPQVELDVLVGAYRNYFYKHQDAKALEDATTVTKRVLQAEQWPENWDSLKPQLLKNLDNPAARLYLNAYCASGLLFARLGKLEAAQTIADQVQQIKSKEFGAEVLHSILNPLPDDDYEDDED